MSANINWKAPAIGIAVTTLLAAAPAAAETYPVAGEEPRAADTNAGTAAARITAPRVATFI